MLTLLRGFDRKRFRLFLVCPEEVAELLAGDVPPDVTVLRLGLRSPRQAGAMLRLGAFLRRERIAVVHSHLFYASLFASPVARACGVPVIVETPHINEFWRQGWKAKYFVDRLAGRCVDRYIAVSHANARYLIDVKGLPARKVEVIQNGCDLSRFAVLPPAEGARKALGFASGDQVLLVVGRLEPQKGHAVMLQALAALRREFPRVRLACVGDGALRSCLEEQARALGCQEVVRFAGYQRNIAEWLSAADVVVLPSLFEGLPLVAIETLAACRPMVATAVDGTPEVVIDGKTGRTVPPGDPQALAGAIAALLRDPGQAAGLAAAGHDWVWERFSEQRQIRETEELYWRAWESRKKSGLSIACGTPMPQENMSAEDATEFSNSKLQIANLKFTPQLGKAQSPNQAVLRETVGEVAVRVCRRSWNDQLRALLLTGSVAREEATILPASGGWRLLGDADLIAVFQAGFPLPSGDAISKLTATCEAELQAAGVTAHVSLAVVHDDYFRRLPAHIFTYELRSCGRVVWGEKNPLQLIPDFPVSAIDTEDAWRMLANRTIECLELAECRKSLAGKPGNGNFDAVLEADGCDCQDSCDPASQPGSNLADNSEELHYRAVKLFLDMATSLLVFLGAYEPTYGQRAEKLEKLAAAKPEQSGSRFGADTNSALPFPLKAFAERVSGCTRWKIAGGVADFAFDADLYGEALDYACRLWRWELGQLTFAAPEASPEMFFAEMAARQSAGQKLRGWLYVVRRMGWLRSLRRWPRWLAMGRRCTPRYSIYEAAWRLAAGAGDARQIEALLPVAHADGRNDGETSQLACAVAWNYRTFLTETRA
jgi:glycosyltransferase involved in cell wall biosynthesis